jgi:hypothetical protein
MIRIVALANLAIVSEVFFFAAFNKALLGQCVDSPSRVDHLLREDSLEAVFLISVILLFHRKYSLHTGSAGSELQHGFVNQGVPDKRATSIAIDESTRATVVAT